MPSYHARVHFAKIVQCRHALVDRLADAVEDDDRVQGSGGPGRQHGAAALTRYARLGAEGGAVSVLPLDPMAKRSNQHGEGGFRSWIERGRGGVVITRAVLGAQLRDALVRLLWADCRREGPKLLTDGVGAD